LEDDARMAKLKSGSSTVAQIVTLLATFRYHLDAAMKRSYADNSFVMNGFKECRTDGTVRAIGISRGLANPNTKHSAKEVSNEEHVE
jgi:hypothetical protein